MGLMAALPVAGSDTQEAVVVGPTVVLAAGARRLAGLLSADEREIWTFDVVGRGRRKPCVAPGRRPQEECLLCRKDMLLGGVSQFGPLFLPKPPDFDPHETVNGGVGYESDISSAVSRPGGRRDGLYNGKSKHLQG